MRVFLDTNILLDILEKRHPHYQASQAVLDACDSNAVSVYLAWHSLSNIFYIYGKKAGAAKAREILKQILEVMTVVSTGHFEALRSMALDFVDLEDAMQAAAAEAVQADYLITRDAAGFANSPVPVVSPESFATLF